MLAALVTLHLLAGSAPADLVPLEPSGVDYRIATAGATAAPWVNANGWRFLLNPDRAFQSDATGPALPLAMAEAFVWGGNVWFRVSDAERPVFDRTLSFFKALPKHGLAPSAQIGVWNDGTSEAGEVLKLLIRRNLMAAPATAPGNTSALMVKLDTPEFPRESAKNPAAFAAGVRSLLGDDNRLLRVYGTDVVVGRLESGNGFARVHLVNYSNRDVQGARIRVLGHFRLESYRALDQPEVRPQDFSVSAGATEFTIPSLTRYAVIDLVADAPAIISKKSGRDFKLTADPHIRHWRQAAPALATKDYTGRLVPLRPTEIRSRWTANNLYILFSCPYESLNLKPNPVTQEETPKLWNWDVAEAFLGSDPGHPERYREFQVSPHGEWVDLEIDRAHPKQDGGAAWNSGFQVKARIDAQQKIWYGEMRIPLAAFTPAAGKELRAGLYRLQGSGADKQFIAWQPTGERSFHVPRAFGILRLQP